MYKLHYAELNSNEDIPCYEFKTFTKLLNCITDFIIGKKNIVFILAIDDNIFVFDKWNECLNYKMLYTGDVFLQEYSSYEEAYKVALDMKETNPLCYEN